MYTYCNNCIYVTFRILINQFMHLCHIADVYMIRLCAQLRQEQIIAGGASRVQSDLARIEALVVGSGSETSVAKCSW